MAGGVGGVVCHEGSLSLRQEGGAVWREGGEVVGGGLEGGVKGLFRDLGSCFRGAPGKILSGS